MNDDVKTEINYKFGKHQKERAKYSPLWPFV